MAPRHRAAAASLIDLIGCSGSRVQRACSAALAPDRPPVSDLAGLVDPRIAPHVAGSAGLVYPGVHAGPGAPGVRAGPGTAPVSGRAGLVDPRIASHVASCAGLIDSRIPVRAHW